MGGGANIRFRSEDNIWSEIEMLVFPWSNTVEFDFFLISRKRNTFPKFCSQLYFEQKLACYWHRKASCGNLFYENHAGNFMGYFSKENLKQGEFSKCRTLRINFVSILSVLKIAFIRNSAGTQRKWCKIFVLSGFSSAFILIHCIYKLPEEQLQTIFFEHSIAS